MGPREAKGRSAASEMESESVVSEGDVELFAAAANGEKVNLRAWGTARPRERDRDRGRSVSTVVEELVDEAAPPPSAPARAGWTHGDGEDDDGRVGTDDDEYGDRGARGRRVDYEDEEENDEADGANVFFAEERSSVRSSRSSSSLSQRSSADGDRGRRGSRAASDASVRAGGGGGGGGGRGVGNFSRFVCGGGASSSRAGGGAGRDAADLEETMEKQSVLLDMERLRMQGIKLSKEWTLDDDLDDMQFEMKRLMLHVDETNNINMMRSTLQLACTGVEMLNRRFNLLQLDGWSEEVCRDMHKYDRALGRIYRKYWRMAHNNSPELEIVKGLLASAGMYHAKRAFAQHVLRPSTAATSKNKAHAGSGPPAARSSASGPRRSMAMGESDDEGMPP